MLRVYRIEYDETYWYVAGNRDDAARMFIADLARICPAGDNTAQLERIDVICESSRALCAAMVKDDRIEIILATSQQEIDQFREDWGPEDLDQATIKPFGQWAQERGRGFFASTV